MIFVCLGSRGYQFNRLLIELDKLIATKQVDEEIVAQIGTSDYVPQNYTYFKFMDKEKFDKYQDDASIIISHGGTGALITALKKGKRVIAVPRLKKFNEHIDDHQIQISKTLEKKKYLLCVKNISDLILAIKDIRVFEVKKYNEPSNVISIIENYINTSGKKK